MYFDEANAQPQKWSKIPSLLLSIGQTREPLLQNWGVSVCVLVGVFLVRVPRIGHAEYRIKSYAPDLLSIKPWLIQEGI